MSPFWLYEQAKWVATCVKYIDFLILEAQKAQS